MSPVLSLLLLAVEENQRVGTQPDQTLMETEVKVILRQRTTQYQLATPKNLSEIHF